MIPLVFFFLNFPMYTGILTGPGLGTLLSASFPWSFMVGIKSLPSSSTLPLPKSGCEVPLTPQRRLLAAWGKRCLNSRRVRSSVWNEGGEEVEAQGGEVGMFGLWSGARPPLSPLCPAQDVDRYLSP